MVKTQASSRKNQEFWGKKSSIYYNSDVTGNKSKIKKDEIREILELEEKEAIVLQNMMLQDLKDEDFALNEFTENAFQKDIPTPPHFPTENPTLNDKLKLSKLLKRECPEFVEWSEAITTQIVPRLNMIHNILFHFQHYSYALTKSSSVSMHPLLSESFAKINPRIIDTLCQTRDVMALFMINFNFYLTHKCSGNGLLSQDKSVLQHPVYAKLKKLHAILTRLQATVSNQIWDTLLPRLHAKLWIKQALLNQFYRQNKIKMLPLTSIVKKTTSLPSPTIHFPAESQKLLESIDSNSTKPSPSFIEENKSNGKQKHHTSKSKLNKTTVKNSLETDEHDVNDDVGDDKRPINYEMLKNKGLTPKRKKEYKNPRVKHRVRFAKALKKRRSQGPLPPKSIPKQGITRVSGIKINLKKSVKIK